MPTRAQLALRRALVEASARRHALRAVPRANLPRSTQYTRALLDVAADLNAEIAEALAAEWLPRIDAADGAAPPFSKGDLMARIRRLAERVVQRRGSALSRALEDVAAAVGSFSKSEWARQAKAAVGVDLSKVEPSLSRTVDRFRAENLDLITSMARDKVTRVARILDDAPNARVETIRDHILEEGEVTKRQAAFITRDQVLSLNAQVAEARHEAAGVTRYIWRTSGDGDVRSDHKELNGKVFAYDAPPVVNASEVRRGRPECRERPGQDWSCRCTAEPLLEFFDGTARADAGDFKEREHPRAKDGQFTSGAGGGPAQAKPPKPAAGPPKGQPTTPSAPSAKPASPPAPAEGPAKLSDEEVARRRAVRQATKISTAEAFGEHNPNVQSAIMGRVPRDSVPPGVRARAVAYYQQMAEIPLGKWPDAFRQFNLHRAAFWAGHTDQGSGEWLEYRHSLLLRSVFESPHPRPRPHEWGQGVRNHPRLVLPTLVST